MLSENSKNEDLAKNTIPFSIESEQALLGTILYENRCIDKISDFLKSEHFYVPLHAKIYEIAKKIINRSQIADPITIKQYLENEQLSELNINIDEYIALLVSSFISISQAETYAKQIYEAFLRREIIRVCDTAVHRAKNYKIDDEIDSQIESISEDIFSLFDNKSQKSSSVPFYEYLSSAIKNAETAFKKDSHIVGTTTGLIDLDKLLGGLHPSDLVILAGRPSMGKTALATNIAFNAALEAKKSNIVFFSLEMSGEQLALRILGQESGIPSDKIRRGAISQENFISFVEASQKLSDLSLVVDDNPILTIPTLRSKIRNIKRKTPIDLIVIDYIQLMVSDSRNENRVQQLSEISRGLKAIAKEFHVPILALSQLSRAVEQRDDKRPLLSDLRESGSIEQDADVVMFIYREEYYKSRAKPSEESKDFAEWQREMSSIHNTAEVIVAKQRHGPISSVKLYFNANLTKFDNYSDK
jgi:replicative DNA helicase